jgi:hypothetical protein
MKINRKTVFSILVVMCCIFTWGCSSKEKVSFNDVDNIRLELIEQKEDINGMSYKLRIQNRSSQVIKQNIVFLSYPIKTDNGSRSNNFKIEAMNNKLNIQPGEEVILLVLAPREMYEGNDMIDIENPNIEIKGFINEVTASTVFHKSGGYRAMKDF